MGGRGAQRSALGPRRPLRLPHPPPPRSGLPPAPSRVRAAPAAAARGPRRAGGGAAGSATCWRWRRAEGAPALPSGAARDWRLGAASQLPRAATVPSPPQPGPLGARAGGRAGWRALLPRRCPGRARAPAARARAPSRRRSSRRAWPRRRPAADARGPGTSPAKCAGTGERGPGRPETRQGWERRAGASAEGRGESTILLPRARGSPLGLSRRHLARLRQVTPGVLGKEGVCGPQGECLVGKPS